MNRLFSRFPGVETLLWVAATVFAFIAFLLFAPGFFTTTAAPKSPNTPVAQLDVAPEPTLTPQPVATPVPPFAPAPRAQTVIPIPTVSAKQQAYSFTADPANSGWVRSSENQPHWGDRNLNVGQYKGQTYEGLLYFDLSALPPGTKISFVDIQLTGLDRERLGPTGTWSLKLLRPELSTDWLKHTAPDFMNASTAGDVGKTKQPEDLAVGVANQFVFSTEQTALLESLVNGKGVVTFRLDGPTGTRDSLFTWDAGGLDKTGIRPVMHVVAVPGAFVSVTNTPTPQNIITAAAQAQTLQAQAARSGTATPFPRNYATATPFILVTPEATPMNQETVVAAKALATAVAVTTGTYTPTPMNFATAFPTPTPLYIPLATLTPFATATPIPSPLQALRTPIPADVKGNIIFLSTHFGNKLPLVMKPDGTILQALSGPDIYNAAHARDMFNPQRTQGLVLVNDSNNQLQVWAQDVGSGALNQITRLAPDKGWLAYDPAWSPDGSKVVYSNSQTGPTELFVYDFATRNSRQITFSQQAIYNQRPSWSPDGKQIVFKSNLSGNWQIWIVNADGSNPHNISNNTYDDTDPVWAK